MSSGNPENLAGVLEELNLLKFDKSKNQNPLDQECIKVFDMMKRVVAGVSESRFKPKSVRDLGCMLRNVTDLYSSQVEHCKQFALEVRDKVKVLSPSRDLKLQGQAVVVIERSKELDQRATTLKKLQNESVHMRNARVVLTPLSKQDLEKYHQLGTVINDPANKSIQENAAIEDLPSGEQEICSPDCDCMDESGQSGLNSGPRRSIRLREKLIGPRVSGCAKNHHIKRCIFQDGRKNNKNAVPQVDYETQVEPFLETDEHEDLDATNEPHAICSYRVDRVKRKFDQMKLVSCRLQNNDGVPLDEFKQDVLERRRKVVQAYVEVIKSFNEPKILDLHDAKAKEFNARIPTPVDDTADKKYQLKLLETIYKENVEIIEIETNADKENSTAFGQSNEVDSGLYDETEVMAIPCLNIMSPSGHKLISETPQWSPDSIYSVDSAYETQESSLNSPMGDKDEFQLALRGTPGDKDGTKETPRFVDFSTIFKKVLDEEDDSTAAVTRCAYWFTDLLSQKWVNVNLEPLRSKSNERSLSDIFGETAMITEANNFDESMSKLGSVCPSVDSVKKRGILQVSITASGVQYLEQDSKGTRETEENDKIIEDEEVMTTIFEQRKGRNSIVRPCVTNNSPQKTVMRELQSLGKRKLRFESDDDKC